MTDTVSNADVARVSEIIAARSGLHFPENRFVDLERGLAASAKQLGLPDLSSLMKKIRSSGINAQEFEVIVFNLTIKETYCFRDKKILEALEHSIIPLYTMARRNAKKTLRIWSAGCSTGEEPYTIAIMLHRLMPDLAEWDITLLATDLNPSSIEKARDGVYNQWAFRETPAIIRDSYFQRNADGRYRVKPHIRRMVTFECLNLATAEFPSVLNNTNSMDIILCRNVLMYFSREVISRIVDNYYRSLLDGGWLVVSPAETSHIYYNQFKLVNFEGATLYRKDVSGKKSDPAGVKYPVSVVPAVSDVTADLDKLIPLVSAPDKMPLTESAFQKTIVESPASESVSTAGNSHEDSRESYEQALQFYGDGMNEKAEETLNAFYEKNREHEGAMTLLARICADRGKLEEALQWCDSALQVNRLAPGLYYLRSVICQEQGQLEEAIISMKKALYLDSDFIMANYSLGNLELNMGRPGSAEKYFRTSGILLSRLKQDEILPESGGLTAGRLSEILKSTFAYKERSGD